MQAARLEGGEKGDEFLESVAPDPETALVLASRHASRILDETVGREGRYVRRLTRCVRFGREAAQVAVNSTVAAELFKQGDSISDVGPFDTVGATS